MTDGFVTMRWVEAMRSDPVASVQGTCLVSALNIPEGRGKRKSPMETLSLLSAGPQLSQRYCHVNILSALVGPIHTSTPPKVEPLHRASYCGRVFQRKCTEMAFL